MGQERLGPSYFFIPVVLGPLNSLVWYVTSLRYTRSLGWIMHCGVEVTESSTNKQHHPSLSGLSMLACVLQSGKKPLAPHAGCLSGRMQRGVGFYTAVPIYNAVRGGGRGIVEDMCYERRRAEACVDQSAHRTRSVRSHRSRGVVCSAIGSGTGSGRQSASGRGRRTGKRRGRGREMMLFIGT